MSQEAAGSMASEAGGGGYDNGTFNGIFKNCPPNDKLDIEHIFAEVVLGLLSLVGVLGNSLSIRFCMRLTDMQIAVNTYTLNLAIADWFISISIPFVIMILQLGFWPFGIYMCKVYVISTRITQFTSSIFVCIMSGDRYMAVCRPVAARRWRTLNVSWFVSAAAWIFTAFIVTHIFIHIALTPEDNLTSCYIGWPEHEFINGQSFMLYFFTLCFAAPFFLISIFSYLIIKKLKTVGPNRNTNKFHRTTKRIMSVIVVYLVGWTPYWMFHLVLLFVPPVECASRTTVAMYLVATCFSYTNCALNPILYAFQYKNCRKSFLMAFPWATGNVVGPLGERAAGERGDGDEGGEDGIALQDL